MRLAVVDVQVQRPLLAQQPPRVLEARAQEGEVVVEAVAVGATGEHAGAVAPAAEPGALAGRVADHAQRPSHLRLARVERRVDVDQLEGAVRERRQQREILAEQDLPLGEGKLRARHERSVC